MPPTLLTMTLALHLDLAEQVVLPSCPIQGQVELVVMEAEAGWVEEWASWEDQVLGSLDGGHLLVLHPMLDHTIN